jgi:fibronectin type 3 domain-containing protein
VSFSWTASTDNASGGATGVGGYYIYRDGAMSTPIATVTTGTSYTDTGLIPGTIYKYQVAAFDRATPSNNVSAPSSPLSVSTPRDVDAPTVPAGLNASAVTASTVTLNWKASKDEPDPGGTGVGGYYVYRDAGATPVATVTNATSYTDTGLAAGTAYQYQVAAFDRESPSNVSAHSAAVTATTTASAGDTQPPTVPSGLQASSVLPTQVTITWAASTDLPNPGGAGIGGYYVYRNGNTSTPIATLTTGTAYTDSGLLVNTAYSYQVAAFDQATPKANVSTPSNPLVVTTAKDTQAPNVPAGLAATGVTVSTVTISWSPASDLPNPGGTGTGGYYVYRNGNTATAIATVTTGTSYADAGLTGGTAYQYQVAAFDRAQPANVSAPSGVITATTSPVTVAPSVPTGLKASGVTVSTITLTWNASTDTTPGGPGVGGYYVYRNGNTATPIATVTTGTSYADTGLIGGTAYQYQVAAFDRAHPANVSAPSGAVAATTSPVTVPPSVPTGLTASGVTVSTITLTWNASTDTTPGGPGVGGYYVYRNGNTATPIATVPSGTSYTDTGLIGGTAYQYQVAAFDRAQPANVSAASGAITATTSPVTVPPSVPTGLKASAVTVSTITLTWNASTDTTPGGPGVGGYYVYRNGNTATPIATVASGTTYADTGLAASTSYQYQVAAFDKASPPNVSAPTAAITATTSASGSVTVTVSPRRAGLTTSQSQVFVATVTGTANTNVTWSVDGVNGGNSTIGTVTSGGLYTPPSSAGVHSITATSVASSSASGSSTAAVTDLAGIYTHHVDAARTGQNLKEYALTPAIVGGAGNFGRLFTCAVDGPMYAHPLYVANLAIGGGTHNVVFLATENDSVYALDADSSSCVIYWQKSFINGSTVLTVPVNSSTGFSGNVGITGTPVINPALDRIYVVAMTQEIGAGNTVSYHHRLHALSLATGSEAAGSPVDITGSVASQGGTIQFDPSIHNQRPALLLSGYASGTAVYIAWASFGDNGNYHGWVMSYDASSLQQIAVWNATPNGTYGGIWMSGGGIAADSSGSLFFSTGNGTFDDKADIIPPMAPGNDFGESYVKLNPTTLNVTDFYTPSQNAYWTNGDLDISSSGLVVLPDGLGPTGHPNILAGSDKQGHFWLIDRDSMSRFNSSSDNTVQYLKLPNTGTCGVECVYSTPAYWNSTIYIAVGSAQLMAIPLVSGLVPASGGVVTASSMSAETYKYPAPTPSISAANTSNAIVWAMDTDANGTGDQSAFSGPIILRAYDATNLGQTLYSSTTNASDKAGNAVKFQAPVVANGKVYLAGDRALTVYGLLP